MLSQATKTPTAVLSFLGLSMLAALTLPAQADDNCGSLQIVNSIQMVRTIDDRADMVPIRFEGGMRYFLFDTGGSVTNIGYWTAQSLKLKMLRGGPSLVDVTGNISYGSAAVPAFVLGNMAARDRVFPISPGNRGIEGIFALDYLRIYDADVDFGTDKLNFFSPDHCPGNVLYWSAPAIAQLPLTLDADGHLTIPVVLDGQDFTAIIDTGAERTSLRADLANEHFKILLGGPDTPQIGNLNGDASLLVYGHVFKSLLFGDVSVNNPVVGIIPDAMNRNIRDSSAKEKMRAPEFIVGWDVLKKLHIYMAFKEKKLYVSTASPAAIRPIPQEYKADVILTDDEVLIDHPDDLSALNQSCFWRAIAQTDLDRALADCDKSLYLKPDVPDQLFDRALVLFQQGKYQEALASLDSILAIMPRYSTAQFLRALTKGKLGDQAGHDADISAATTNPQVLPWMQKIGLVN